MPETQRTSIRRRRGVRRSLRGPRARDLLPFVLGAVVGGLGVAGGVWLWHRDWAGASEAAHRAARTARWADLPEAAFPIPPYARFLKGVKIVLDPGHVGQYDPGGEWKRGPTGLREAEVNLRVAQELRRFLREAGAEVTLTREVDRSPERPDPDDLESRAEVANAQQADLFLSIHHNAADSPQANYTAVFYHGSLRDGGASLAAGRFILNGLQDALRLESHLECGLVSDGALTSNGFAVLRAARVPAVLTEASFHTNPAEEQRLRDPEYNRREAYGMFLGLARWAQAGLPRVRVEAVRSRAKKSPDLDVVLELDDGLSSRRGLGADQSHILKDTIVVHCAGKPLKYSFDPRKRQLTVTVPGSARQTPLYVSFQNIFGQPVLHPWITIADGG